MNDALPHINIDSIIIAAFHLGPQTPVGPIPVYQADNLVYKVIAVRKDGSCTGCCFDGLGLCQDVPCGSAGFIFKKVDDMLEGL